METTTCVYLLMSLSDLVKFKSSGSGYEGYFKMNGNFATPGHLETWHNLNILYIFILQLRDKHERNIFCRGNL